MLHALPPLLAENFDYLWIWVLALPAALAVGAAASFVGAARGHWSGPVIAGPVAGLGALLFLSVAMARPPVGILLLAMLPGVMGVASIALWAQRRGRAK